MLRKLASGPALRTSLRYTARMWAWLAGCDDEPGRGVKDAEPVVCLAGPEGAELPVDGVFTGLATADSADLDADWRWGERCADRGRVFELEDAAGRWQLGYGWSEGGSDQTPRLDLRPLSPVTFSWHTVGRATGFVLRDADQDLVAALEVGTGSPALPTDAVDNFVVGSGEVTGSVAVDCGRLVSRQLTFTTGGETLALETIDGADAIVEGKPRTAWALTNTALQDATCEADTRRAWAVWRETP